MPFNSQYLCAITVTKITKSFREIHVTGRRTGIQFLDCVNSCTLIAFLREKARKYVTQREKFTSDLYRFDINAFALMFNKWNVKIFPDADYIIIQKVKFVSCRGSFKLLSVPTKQQGNLKFPDERYLQKKLRRRRRLKNQELAPTPSLLDGQRGEGRVGELFLPADPQFNRSQIKL